MIKVGLTGGIATGKSTVVGYFKEAGAAIIDADRIAHEVVKKGQKAYLKILETFGEEILDSNLELNRPKLGSIVFSDKEARMKLNDIVHPEVRAEMINQTRDLEKKENLKGENFLVVFDIPLLFESKLAYMVDVTLVVYCTHSLQIERLIKRDNLSNEEALQRINSQISIEEKVKYADEVIDNSKTLNFTKEQVEMFLNKYSWDPVLN